MAVASMTTNRRRFPQAALNDVAGARVWERSDIGLLFSLGVADRRQEPSVRAPACLECVWNLPDR
jgi:hypothetical protein